MNTNEQIVHDLAASLPDEVQYFHFWKNHLPLKRQLFPLEFLKILHLREFCSVYARYLASFTPSGRFLL